MESESISEEVAWHAFLEWCMEYRGYEDTEQIVMLRLLRLLDKTTYTEISECKAYYLCETPQIMLESSDSNRPIEVYCTDTSAEHIGREEMLEFTMVAEKNKNYVLPVFNPSAWKTGSLYKSLLIIHVEFEKKLEWFNLAIYSLSHGEKYLLKFSRIGVDSDWSVVAHSISRTQTLPFNDPSLLCETSQICETVNRIGTYNYYFTVQLYCCFKSNLIGMKRKTGGSDV